MAIDQGRPIINPWYGEFIMWREDRHISPEERARVLRQVVEAMIGVTMGIDQGVIVKTEIMLEFASPISDENVGFHFSWPNDTHE